MTCWSSWPASGTSGTPPTRSGEAALGSTEVLPLYSRLSAADQHKVFQAHTGRRIVLATNVAETSLTVPGIRYVVDPGTARISRYSHRTKVQRLPIEAISQASARQRSGRCGRTSDGIAIRLYSEEDFEGRPEFTDPEILRTNLASVLLQMASLGLGEVEDFPFLDPPDRRSVADGIALLEELGALDARGAADRDRAGTGRAAAGPPAGPDGRGGRPARGAGGGAGHRRRAHRPGRARATRPTRRPPPTSCTPGSPRRTPTSPRSSPCGGTSPRSRPSCRATSSAARSSASTCTGCGSASGRTCTASCAAPPAGWA